MSYVGKESLPKAPACQTPHVNIFKHFCVDEWKLASREGCVESVMDKIIGKKVLRIMGNVLAANNMRLPRKNSPSPSLGLTGRYIYTQVRTVPDKYYVLHLFIQAKDDSVMDMSITNLFKETRVIGNVLQFPCNLSPKWTTICVDMVQVLQQHKGLPFKCLKGIQVCSNLFVRNAFTTDVLHTAATLPKDFAFPLPQGRELDSFYDWVSITEGPAGSENASPNMALAEQMRIHKLMSSSKPARTSYHGAGGMGGVNTSSSGRNHTFADETRTTDAPPNPALEMRWCIGHTGKSPHSMLWSNDSRWILYPCSSLIVAMNPEMSEQRFFIGHTGDVTVMAMGPNDELLASCQEGKCPLIRLWNFATGDCVGLVTAHGRDVSCIGFNRDASKMVAVGKDDKGAGRNFLNSVVVWDLAKVAQGGKAVKIAEHTFGPSLNKIAFCPFDDGHLVSCGDDNIHLWRIKAVHKKEELRKIALPLGPHGGENFLDIAFEGTLGSADPLSRKIYASTGTGLVYQINYTNRCVEQIYRLHDAGIKALVVTDGFCVTGSDDRFLRVWPLDFSDYFLEAQHAAPVTSVGVSSDSLKIAISTQNGTVGVMDVPSHGYRTVVRSHENSVCAMAMDPNNREFTTTAADGTIRTWDLDSYDQLYEFLAPGECARCVEYHPSLYVIACGFDNGAVRIFDMASTSQLHEYRQHQGRVMALAFSPDGSRLFSAATDGHFCVYDAPRNYQPIKTVACSHAGDDVAIALSPDGKLLTALGVHGSSILVLDTASMDKVAEIPVLGRTLRLLRFAPTTGELLAVTSDSRLHRYDLDRCELSHESAPLHVGSVLSVQISDNGKLLLTGGSEGLVKVWALPENGAGGPTERKCQSFVGHPSAVTCVQFTADKKQVVSAGVGYGILVWDLMADAAEDLSDFVDRLIEQRAVEMQATDAKMAAELAEDSTPEFPQLFSIGGGAGGPSTEASFIDSIRKLNVPAADPDASDLSSEYDTAPVNNRADEPSPLARVRERAHNLDISLTMTPAAPARESEQGGQGRGLLPLIHYRSRRLQPLRAERKFVAPEHEAGLKIVQMVGLNAEGRGSLAWHPASGVLATGVGSTVMVEQLETGAKRFLQGHDTDISCLALSLDGSMLASARGSADAAVPPVVVWAIDSAKPEPLLQLNCHHEGVQCLAWSDDGRYLLSVGNYLDGKMGILSTDTREMLLTTDLLHPVHAAVFSPGGREVVTAGHLYVTFWRFKADGVGNIQVFREERMAPNEEPGAHYTCIDLSPDGLTFYVGSSTGGVSQWSLRGDHATCTASWTTEQGELTAIRIREGGVVTCGQEPHIRSWQLEADEAGEGYWQVTRETHLDSYVTSLQYDGANGVASTAAGSVYRLSDSAITPKSSAVRIGGGHAAKVTDLAYSERGDMAASCDEGGAVMVWAASGMELLRTYKPSSASCGCVAFSPSGKTVVAGYADGVVRHLAVGSAAATTSDAYLVSSGVPITAVAFASGGDPAVMVGSASGSITCSKIVSGSSSGSSMQVVSACPAAGSPVICLKQSADGKGTWLSTCANGLLRVFTHDTYTGSSVLIHQDIIQNEAAIFADFSPSEPSILVCGGPGLGNGIYFYDFALKRIVKRFAGIDQVASSLAVSHSGTLITMGTEEALVKIVDYDEGTFQDFAVHSDVVSSMAFSPAGGYLITAADTDIVLWSVRI